MVGVSETTPQQNRQSSERSAVVDLAAVEHNVRRLLELARGRTLIAVVKADAYGHGAPEVARAALAAGAHMLGTAHVAEALALRDAGITAPVLAWLHTPSTDFASAVARGVRLGISGGELDAVLDAARAAGTPAVVHLKLDSGLGRNGATEQQWPELVARAARTQDEGLLTVEGIFTHLAVADEPGRPETTEQLDALTRAVAVARAAGLAPRMVHAANTPGLLSAQDLPDPDVMLRDAVRVGLGLYGLSPFADRTPADLGLAPAMTLRARVANVKAVPAGAGVSYGLTYRTDAPTHLALVPLGYADGVPRVATGAPVHIGTDVYPVVGRIAMDQCVVDLSRGRDAVTGESRKAGSEPTVRIGDEAVLFGAAGHPSAADWADAAGTINYEVVTRISPRVPREHVRAAEVSGVVAPRGAEDQGGREHGGDAPAAQGAARDEDAEQAGRPEWALTRHPGTPEEMRALGEALAGSLRAGDLVLLNGELGAGKTTFTQGLGAGLGVREGIISPTFVLTRRHPNRTDVPHPGGPDLVHVDAYRLATAEDVDTIDLEDTLDTCVTVVEWGTGKVEHLSPSRLVVDIDRARGAATTPAAEDLAGVLADLDEQWGDGGAGSEPRRVTVRGVGPRWSEPPAL
ncbi:bifunctional alanine racemase/tRNA (adenosine(37)-N6)-threonylcarbamoyltransferase complex ATPase subunit type 1 TsaE [Kocuria tytonicola]|uniref:alanine racemase n=1 Tax=Kocuria tytonicola TaxID=2055946 RepID=UPI000EF8D808|nr:alanine racemase [Kocuria tytonicola]RLZ03420.1 bifunctional alanine racemase/tRNA (adenosine(37)-N6)-threonylcarbamoyltransferase complex ATPase subunit type 1 TsaE [Kocuria tytonicola]